MPKYLRLVLLTAILGLLSCSAGYAQYPSVELLSFDPASFTYVYRVIQGTDAIDSFSQFEVDAYTETSDPYSMSGPVSNQGGDEAWWTTITTWMDPETSESGTAYMWYGGNVPPGEWLPGGEAWIGDFTLIVENTMPVPGLALTMGGSAQKIPHTVDVPGPVPEPASCTALCTLLLGMAPAVYRLRKR